MPSSTPKRIVVVDDDPDSRELFCEFLRMSGFATVDEYDTAEDALAAIALTLPAVVILDMTLPGEIDGYECARRLRANAATQNVPVIAVTGHSRADVEAHGVRFDSVMRKPVDLDELTSRLRELLA